MDEIDITGLDKRKVLIALYESARVQGMGILHARSERMTIAEAGELLAPREHGEPPYFDYVHGRVLKVNLAGDKFSPRLYDRDNGHGAAQRAVDAIR